MIMLHIQALNSKEQPKTSINCHIYILGSKLFSKNNNQNFLKICYFKKQNFCILNDYHNYIQESLSI